MVRSDSNVIVITGESTVASEGSASASGKDTYFKGWLTAGHCPAAGGLHMQLRACMGRSLCWARALQQGCGDSAPRETLGVGAGEGNK